MPLPDFFPSDRVCVDNSQIVTLENQLTCTREEDCRRVNQTCLKFLDGSGFCVAKYSGYEPSDAAASEEPVHGETDQAGNDNIETEPLPSPIESVVQEDDPADILASPGLLADESELDELLEGSSEAFGDAETFDDQIIASAEPIFVNVLLDDENLLSDSESEIDAQADVAQAQQPQASEEPVEQSCIAVHHLKGERLKNALLYKSDVLARVLCDENESCATPGHMVIYRERAMMMRSYCELAGKCTERFLKVNGLKYERGKRVGSLSDGLSFSALAARFESKMEELVLKTAVHIGL
ncbi:hypothetical protein BWQ96_06209 [Gracilariopsis chorda]|uniref:Uncharacterized protein n=1 Tax=Gracilariopsis chorda TaxID=448386 RepID=A0A2V3IPM5_9FLOR|nr:hypothetical protein BWQ96_06209 [Gracilariopsis chorda]|eukprot:PXF44036.1 hypothetical protein BWQ96_06209 [Gracilariopsis chorda]